MSARLSRLHRLGFQQDHACDDLQAIGDPVLNFFEHSIHIGH
jgi:hypothetical protein